jgi:hypothetical protein
MSFHLIDATTNSAPACIWRIADVCSYGKTDPPLLHLTALDTPAGINSLRPSLAFPGRLISSRTSDRQEPFVLASFSTPKFQIIDVAHPASAEMLHATSLCGRLRDDRPDLDSRNLHRREHCPTLVPLRVSDRNQRNAHRWSKTLFTCYDQPINVQRSSC